MDNEFHPHHISPPHVPSFPDYTWLHTAKHTKRQCPAAEQRAVASTIVDRIYGIQVSSFSDIFMSVIISVMFLRPLQYTEFTIDFGYQQFIKLKWAMFSYFCERKNILSRVKCPRFTVSSSVSSLYLALRVVCGWLGEGWKTIRSNSGASRTTIVDRRWLFACYVSACVGPFR